MEWASFFTEENGVVFGRKKKGKEEPSKCESIRSVDSVFFVLFCLAFAKNPTKLPPTSFFLFLSRSTKLYLRTTTTQSTHLNNNKRKENERGL